ncbi:N-acetylmuramic acid 6-phosphate etherase [Paenibacillus glucanolyticus]|uniref:N-acetylmuramic acid 6-phosphate etherase n=1 Tax=Paenibacillus glucanolyticus TaxID=59843 RepID=A0A163HIG8_9BACL|nr:N-acetylmuramic acid 6-phosphate etherase [Paenibacillus glucanolyticus]KZS45499.1 N-acetylmuramic acid 6-phosphate etherase [Paenibacillus glucanolyticus]
MTNTLSQLTTEQPHEHTQNIDQLSSEQIMILINNEDSLITETIRDQIPLIARAADLVVEAFENGGRLFYIGAGTSGRIGILDASECPPTYGTDPSMVQGLIAGGFRAVKEAIEGAEDSEELGAQDINENGISKKDVVIGIAASGRTPYVLGAMRRAKELGAVVVGLCNNYESPMHQYADFVIEAVVGPEVIMGSTRMKAGTSQKLILNMLTTTAMIRIGKVYKNLMVDLNPSNNKLVHRAKRIITLATGASEEEVEKAYHEAGAHVKTAIVMLLANVSAAEASTLLDGTRGFVRGAIDLKASK